VAWPGTRPPPPLTPPAARGVMGSRSRWLPGSSKCGPWLNPAPLSRRSAPAAATPLQVSSPAPTTSLHRLQPNPLACCCCNSPEAQPWQAHACFWMSSTRITLNAGLPGAPCPELNTGSPKCASNTHLRLLLLPPPLHPVVRDEVEGLLLGGRVRGPRTVRLGRGLQDAWAGRCACACVRACVCVCV